jgi:ankyrin repeat protein
VDSTDKYGRTPLILAALQGHVDIKKLLNHDATVDITDINRRISLSKAAENGYVKVVTTLLNHGARVESADK